MLLNIDALNIGHLEEAARGSAAAMLRRRLQPA
jgi:hypothetical protein